LIEGVLLCLPFLLLLVLIIILVVIVVVVEQLLFDVIFSLTLRTLVA